MTGSLPTELGILTSLEVLDLSYNTNLGGNLPFELCDLTNLKRLELGFNSLTGNLPACLATGMPELVELIAPNASLSGPFPDLCEMTKLQVLNIRYNQFAGGLPKCVWPDAKYLFLSDNLFEVSVVPLLVGTVDRL
jgi:Leucine-rich repeat (LRR) protein